MSTRSASSPTGSLAVTIEGFDMPGRSCEPAGAEGRHENVHVGVQRGKEVVDLVPGDAVGARWSIDVASRVADNGAIDVGGPYVHGRRGDRFLYLSWCEADETFRMFRRAKLHFADCDPEVLVAAFESGRLLCRVRMSDACGHPRCARVRPPDAIWTAPGS